MNLLKAIEIGELNIKVAGKQMPADTLTALKILVEAGSRLLLARSYGDKHCQGRLSNEIADPAPSISFRMKP